MTEQITLGEAQLERSETPRTVYDARSGENVDVLQAPVSMGTFKDPRDAVRGLQAARGQRAYTPPPPAAPLPQWRPPEAAAYTPFQLIMKNREIR